MTPIFKDWGFFSFSYFALVAENMLGLSLVVQTLSPIAFSEWAVLSALVTVAAAMSQLGLKTAYMQLVADRVTRSRQHQALRAAFVLLGVTGFFAGLMISMVLALCAHHGLWESAAVLWVLPFLIMMTNLQMVLVTELRLSHRVQRLMSLSYQRAIVFILVIVVLNQCLNQGLHLIYWAQLCSSGFMVLRLLSILHIHRFFSVIRWRFLPSAISLGWPVMMGLLFKYGSDAVLSMGMRWSSSVDVAANYGRAIKILEPFNALFFTAFVMAWGANAYVMAANETLKKHLDLIARIGLGLCCLGLVLAYPAALIMQWVFPELGQTSLIGFEFFMVLARLAAFAALSPVQFGWIVARDYRWGMVFNGLELLLTATLFLYCLFEKQYEWALVVGALIPWVSVGFQYLVSTHHYRSRTQINALT